MTVPAIFAQGLTKYYGHVRGVEDLDMEVAPGEVFGFLGPNGAGKTTTLRLLLDLIRPDKGRASILGLDVRMERTAVHRVIGYLPGELAMWPELTGAENLEYLARLRGGVDAGYLAQLLERLDVDATRRFREYSRGNKQKVGLVQAFMHRPQVLLLDEPTSGLDPLVQNVFHELVCEAAADGRTVFLSSHVLSEVERMCHRVGIIRDGRLVSVAKVGELGVGAVHLVRFSFRSAVSAEAFAAVSGLRDVAAQAPLAGMDGATGFTATLTGDPRPLLEALLPYDLVDFESRRPSLEELFLAFYDNEGPDTGSGVSE